MTIIKPGIVASQISNDLSGKTGPWYFNGMAHHLTDDWHTTTGYGAQCFLYRPADGKYRMVFGDGNGYAEAIRRQSKASDPWGVAWGTGYDYEKTMGPTWRHAEATFAVAFDPVYGDKFLSIEYVPATKSTPAEYWLVKYTFPDWNPTNLSYSQEKSFNRNADALYFANSGTKMYYIRSGVLYQRTLSTGWNVGTIGSESSIDLDNVSGARTGFRRGLFVNDTGEHLYTLNTTAGYVEHFEFGTAWDISTISFSEEMAFDNNLSGDPAALTWHPDGHYMYLAHDNEIARYDADGY